MIDLRSLRYVVTLARRLSYARAAEELGVSQPALTRAVQSLEARFGVRLFDRDRSGVRLTAQGRAMVDAAAGLVAGAQDLERQWFQVARGQSGEIRFGMAPLPTRTLLASTLQDFLVARPGLRFDVVVRNVEMLWPLLVNDEIEFFVAAEGQVPENIPVRTEVLGQFPNDYIVRPGHPLLRGDAPGTPFPLLLSSRSALPHATGDERFLARPVHIVEDFDTLVRLTASTDAIWRISAYAVAEEIRRGELVALPNAAGNGPAEFQLLIYSLARRSRSGAAMELVQGMRHAIRQLHG